MIVFCACARGAQKIEYRGVAQLGDVCDRCLWQIKEAIRSGSDLPIGETFAAMTEA